MDTSLKIHEGRCHILVAFDIGQMIDLDVCERRITEAKQRETMRHRRRAPSHFQYQPLPVRVSIPCDPLVLGQDFATASGIDIILYDFGAALVAYTIPLHGPVERLLPLSDALYDRPEILDHARWQLQRLIETLGDAVVQGRIASVYEDYVIFEINRWHHGDGPIREWCTSQGNLLAQILRSERGSLAPDATQDALHCSLSFAPTDVTYIDWNASIIFDPDAADTVAVLEYANVELLELRWLDERLDHALDEAYQALVKPRHRLMIRSRDPALDRVAQLQVDGALLFEGVNNALKLVGDQYLARVYQLATQRFHLADWDAAILRKLDVLDSIHSKMSDRQSAWRMEALEWIIIVLIAVSMVLPFITGKH